MFADFVDGPFWYFSLTVFVVGATWRVFSVLRFGPKRDLSVARASGVLGAIRTNISRFFPRREIAKRIRVQVVAGYVFHIALFALLIFAAPHMEFIRDRITGFGWPTLPYWAFVVVSQLALIGLLVLWLHRMLDPVTRFLTRADDHIAAILLFTVMLTGCMALFQQFEALRVTHLFLAELLLIYFPFSSLMHAILFVPTRSFTGYTLGRRGVQA